MTVPRIVIPVHLYESVMATQERHNAAAALQAAKTERRNEPTFTLRRENTLNLETAADVSDDVVAAAIELFEMWYDNDDEPIDWCSFFDRLEDTYRLCVTNPEGGAARKIQRCVRDHRKAGE